ncbi:Caleosin related protein-domain-containing protein [Lentinula detonsa]|uniref:Caleosin related protein-domain-containing protein n=1 Tax=Lentinula detonsa TaxID=2804962 RepID=A0A9W8P7C8_9AGAR|nr:Caleosin related protein-domain-containing protein [Lentinula detonsa]
MAQSDDVYDETGVNDSQAYLNDDSQFADDGHALQVKDDDGDRNIAGESNRDAGEEKTGAGGGEAMIGHGEFFDPDGDGIFSPFDTFNGFRALGYSIILSIFSAMVISTMSYPSLPSGHWLPDPFFRIHVKGLHKAKHGSDSGSFKRDGRFDEERFDEFWDSHTDAPHAEITPFQLYAAVAERRLAYDFYGIFAAIFEWLATWLLFGYPSFHFDFKLAFEKIRKLIFGKDRITADAAEWRKLLADTLQKACSGGNVKKEDVKGLYNGMAFYAVMDSQADAGNEWAKSLKRKHEGNPRRYL